MRLCAFCICVLHIRISIQYLYFTIGVRIFGSRSHSQSFFFWFLGVDFLFLMPPKSKKAANSEATIEDSESSFSESTVSSGTVT